MKLWLLVFFIGKQLFIKIINGTSGTSTLTNEPLNIFLSYPLYLNTNTLSFDQPINALHKYMHDSIVHYLAGSHRPTLLE